MRDGTATKELIARTALRLFVEKGIAETTIRDIASAAGISEGAMYRHYTGKDALAWELFATNFTHFASELEGLREKHPTLKAQIAAMIRTFCEFFDRDPILFSYLLIAQHGQLKKVTPDMPHPLLVLRDTIAEGMKRGEIPKRDPMVVTSMMLGLVLQVATSKMYRRFEQSLTSLADTLVEASWRVLAA